MQHLRCCFLMSAGIYISIPFCRSKCTSCTFASGVFATGQMSGYVERISEDIGSFRALAKQHGAIIPDAEGFDSICLGGGTPSLLPSKELQRLFSALENEFDVFKTAE